MCLRPNCPKVTRFRSRITLDAQCQHCANMARCLRARPSPPSWRMHALCWAPSGVRNTLEACLPAASTLLLCGCSQTHIPTLKLAAADASRLPHSEVCRTQVPPNWSDRHAHSLTRLRGCHCNAPACRPSPRYSYQTALLPAGGAELPRQHGPRQRRERRPLRLAARVPPRSETPAVRQAAVRSAALSASGVRQRVVRGSRAGTTCSTLYRAEVRTLSLSLSSCSRSRARASVAQI